VFKDARRRKIEELSNLDIKKVQEGRKRRREVQVWVPGLNLREESKRAHCAARRIGTLEGGCSNSKRPKKRRESEIHFKSLDKEEEGWKSWERKWGGVK